MPVRLEMAQDQPGALAPKRATSRFDVDQSRDLSLNYCFREKPGPLQMSPATKSAVTYDVDQARRDVEQARMSVKEASARSDDLLKIDMNLFARSRGQIANVRDRLKQTRENAPHRSDHLRGAIDRNVLERYLAQANRRVAAGEEHLSRQRERVAQLESDGRDASNARRLLEQFEQLQSMHVAHRDRLVRQLGNVA